MTDDELEYSLDAVHLTMLQQFNAGDRVAARRLSFVFHALLRERAARLINEGTRPCKPVLPSQGSPSPISMTGE